MSSQYAFDNVNTVPGGAFTNSRVPLPTDLVNSQGVQGAHDVRHGQLSPPLAPEIQIPKVAVLEGSGVSNRKKPGSSTPGNANRHTIKQKSSSQLNAAAPVFVPTSQIHNYGEPKSVELSPASKRIAFNHQLAHSLARQHSAAQHPAIQDYDATQKYPAIQHYPVAQQFPALPYPVSQNAIPPYIFHQYLTPQYGIHSAPLMPPQMVPMFSTVQQAMEYQHYLADRARSKAHVEHEASHSNPPHIKGHRKRLSWQRRQAARAQRKSEDTEYVYVGYYFDQPSRQADNFSSSEAHLTQFLPVIPLEGHYTLGSEVRFHIQNAGQARAFLPLLPLDSNGTTK